MSPSRYCNQAIGSQQERSLLEPTLRNHRIVLSPHEQSWLFYMRQFCFDWVTEHRKELGHEALAHSQVIFREVDYERKAFIEATNYQTPKLLRNAAGMRIRRGCNQHQTI